MKYLLLMGCLSVLQSCLCTRKAATQKSRPYAEPFLPYAALDRSKLDTTFDYEVLVKEPVYVKMPDEVMSAKLTGDVEFFVLIDERKTIVDIAVVRCKLYKGKTLYYDFSNEGGNPINEKLKSYLLNFMKDRPFKQTKGVAPGRHPTYFFMTFIQ